MNKKHSLRREATIRACEMDEARKYVAKTLGKSGDFVATAESCTAGEMAMTLTSISGASNWFSHGFITYSEQAKIDLGVNPEDIKKYTVYSGQVAWEMALMATTKAECRYGVGITGVTGPGPDQGIPAGAVWISIVDRKSMTELSEPVNVALRKFTFKGDRIYNRTAAAHEAIIMLANMLAGEEVFGKSR